MKQDTHIAFSTGLALALSTMLHLGLACTTAAIAAAVTVNWLVDRVGHERRGRFIVRSAWSHSILFITVTTLAILYPLTLIWVCSFTTAAVPALAGSLSHLALDAVTKNGVAPFWPLSRRRVRGVVRYDDRIVNWVFRLAGLLLWASVAIRLFQRP